MHKHWNLSVTLDWPHSSWAFCTFSAIYNFRYVTDIIPAPGETVVSHSFCMDWPSCRHSSTRNCMLQKNNCQALLSLMAGMPLNLTKQQEHFSFFWQLTKHGNQSWPGYYRNNLKKSNQPSIVIITNLVIVDISNQSTMQSKMDLRMDGWPLKRAIWILSFSSNQN